MTNTTASGGRSPRVFVLGFDAATFWLIDPWVAEGKLPNFARLMREGVRGSLDSTIPYVSGPAWVSFATGVNPGKHGVFDFARRQPGGYGIQLVNARDIRSATLWSLLSQAGLRLGSLNCPVTYPPRPVNGFLVGGMLSPSLKSDFTYPKELRDQLLRAVPDYLIESAETSPDRAQTKAAVARNVRQGTQARAKATRFLLEWLGHWDLFVSVYSETDRVMTYLWDDMDPQHPRHDPDLAARFGHEILRHYQELDAILGQTMEEVVDERTTLLVLSDHGFGGVYRFFYPNRWLHEQGYLTLKQGSGTTGLVQGAKGLLRRLRVAHLVKQTLHRLFPHWGFTSQLRQFAFTRDVDWSRTRAFWAADNGVTINVAGREPEGIVRPGAEYEALRDEIAAGLLALREPGTGERVVAAVHRREEIYSGPYIAESPDLRVVWQEYPDERRTHFSAGELWGESTFGPAGQTGDHCYQGVFLAWGQGVRRGATIQGAAMVDVAPTILWLLGQPIPQEMDGRVLREAFEADWAAQRPIQHSQGEARPPDASELAGFSDEESEAVRERLRGLGYLS
ncbi:MAG: hypothetical protein GX605_05425 [Chloroflexi bacterium]|nr:hypothetical protein [Chloroflexota bacterium]